jgi:hypothetical protein
VERGFALEGQERYDEALREFSEVLLFDPDNATARAELYVLDRKLAARRGATARSSAQDWQSWPITLGGASLNPPDTEFRADALAYVAFSQYHDTTAKDFAELGGVYGRIQFGPAESPASEAEVEVDYLNLHYKNQASLQQWDVTLALAGQPADHWRIRYGGHLVFSDDPATDHGWSVFGGAHYFEPWRWDAGADFSFSKYPDYSGQLEVWQTTPHFGINLLQGSNYTVRADARAYWIHPSQSVAGDDQFLSGEGRLTFFWGRWVFSGFGWAGKQAFVLRPDTFALFNVAEEHTAGYGVEIRRAFTPGFSAVARANREQFKESGSTQTSLADLFTLLFNYSF